MHSRPWRRGLCWRCERTDLPVLWLGPVETDYGVGAMHAREECIQRLEDLTRADLTQPRHPH